MTPNDPCPTCAAVPNEETDELYARIAMLESDLAVARAELAETQQSHGYALDEIAKLRASLEAVTDALREVQTYSDDTGQCVVCDYPVSECDDDCLGSTMRAALSPGPSATTAKEDPK